MAGVAGALPPAMSTKTSVLKYYIQSRKHQEGKKKREAKWWQNNYAFLPHWAALASKIILVQLSSACSCGESLFTPYKLLV